MNTLLTSSELCYYSILNDYFFIDAFIKIISNSDYVLICRLYFHISIIYYVFMDVWKKSQSNNLHDSILNYLLVSDN